MQRLTSRQTFNKIHTDTALPYITQMLSLMYWVFTDHWMAVYPNC